MIPPPALSAAIGQRVRELRTSSGVSVSRLAKQAGVPSKEILAIESGKARPSVATLDAVARPLKISVLELVRSARSSAPVAPVASPERVPRGLEGIARAIADLPARLGDKIDAVEAAVVEHAIERSGGNRSAAARLLGMERKALIRRWQRAQLEAKRRTRKSV